MTFMRAARLAPENSVLAWAAARSFFARVIREVTKMAGKLKDLTGQRFGKLLAVRRIENLKCRVARWQCVCDCGAEHNVFGNHLRTGVTTECTECWRSKRVNRHESTTRLYEIWTGMRKRCDNQSFKQFKDYGGKGVKVCDSWLDFQAFKKWALLNGYTEIMTIDRVDSSGNYEPSNCEWVTKGENSRRGNVGRWARYREASA